MGSRDPCVAQASATRPRHPPPGLGTWALASTYVHSSRQSRSSTSPRHDPDLIFQIAARLFGGRTFDMFRAQANAFDDAVFKATDENLTSENWEYILVRFATELAGALPAELLD